MGGVFEKCCKSKPPTQAEKDKKAEKDMDKARKIRATTQSK